MTDDTPIPFELTRDWWEWENWHFSAGIAEALFAAWAQDTTPEANVRWWTSRQPWDVKSDTHSVDVKDAFIGPARQASGETIDCLAFMGTKRGPGNEARDTVTHYGLVVRTLADGKDKVRIHSDGTVTITADASFRIFLVPRDVVNTFESEYTQDGTPGKRLNRFLPLAEAAQYLVFDNRQARARRTANERITTLTEIAETAWHGSDGLRSDAIDAVLDALMEHWVLQPTSPERDQLFTLTYNTYMAAEGEHRVRLREAVQALTFAAATGDDQTALEPLLTTVDREITTATA